MRHLGADAQNTGRIDLVQSIQKGSAITKMRMTIKRIVILSDLQVPFEDVHVTRNIAKFLQTFKPDQTVTIGDEIDFQTISKWSEGTPQAYEQSLGDDRDRCVDLLWELGVTDCIRSNHTDCPALQHPGLLSLG